jgi:hypothetical protein
MQPLTGTRDIDFGGPAAYRIVVKGELGPEWSDRLGGLAIQTTQQTGESPHTALVGCIRDQAELNGVLETLYSLHLPILRVEQVEDES